MKLFCPILCFIEAAKKQHHERSKLGMLLTIGRLSGTDLLEDVLGYSVRTKISIAMIKAVVGQAAARLVKMIVAPLQGIEEIVQSTNLNIGGGAEPINPRVKVFGIVHAQCPVRTKRGQDLDFKIGSRKLAVGREAVAGIIGRANGPDFKPSQDALCSEPVILGQQCVGALPDLWRSAWLKYVIDAEIAFKFEMGPMKERIAQRIGHSGSPYNKFFVVGGVAGAESLGHAVGTHRSPLVVVSIEPYVRQVVE